MGGNRVRKRVAQACERCRQRKFKCDGKRPECSTCIQATQVCMYEPHIRRRGLPEGYVRGMELIAGLAIHHLPDFEKSILSRLLQNGKGHGFEWQPHFEDLIDGWRNSRLSNELEHLLPSLPSTKSIPSKRTFEDSQPALNGPRHFWPRMTTPQQSGNSGQRSEHDEQASSHHSDLHKFIKNTVLGIQAAQASSMAVSPNRPAQTPTVTKLPQSLHNLIKLYFSSTHCWLPIVERSRIMRSSYYFLGENGMESPHCGSLALIWAITALTTSQLSKSGRLAEFLEIPNVPDGLVSSYYTKAREMIPFEDGPFDVGHVQSLLLLSLIKIDQSAWSPLPRFLLERLSGLQSIWILCRLLPKLLRILLRGKYRRGKNRHFWAALC